jgi:hypothetical protein
MDRIVLFKIGTLHARSVQERGLKVRHRGRETFTGPMMAHLDDRAEVPANLGLLDLTTGTIRIQWAVLATVPFLADAFAGGHVTAKDNAALRVSLEESGRILDDGSGFSVKGQGEVGPGSVFSRATIPLHANLITIPTGGLATALERARATGDGVHCTMVPESSHLDIALPRSLGGGTQRLHLMGGFTLLPLMTLTGTEKAARSRR